jgi:hypothetical protein
VRFPLAVCALVGLGCAGAPQQSVAIEPLPAAGSASDSGAAAAGPAVAQLTGGVGNHVVDSFDQLRAAVRPLGPAIDECYRSTAGEGGWRENLMWDLEVSERGRVTRVTLHAAEYWRGERVVPGTPGAGLAACMERTLRALVVPPPVRAGWIRLRFET